jgi:hypothetical protein
MLSGAKVVFCKTCVWKKVGLGTESVIVKGKELLKEAGADEREIELSDDFSMIPE